MYVKLLSDMKLMVKLFDTTDKELLCKRFFKGSAPGHDFHSSAVLVLKMQALEAKAVYLYRFKVALIFK